MPQGNSVIHPYHISFRTLHFALHIQQWRNHTTLHPSLQSKINLNARSWTLSTPGKRDEETSINTLHLFDLRCTWSKAEGNSAWRIIYALFMEKHSSHDIADCSVACNSYTACLLLHNFAGEPSLIENAWTGCCSERLKQPICAIMFSR